MASSSSVLAAYEGALRWTFAHFSGGAGKPLFCDGWLDLCEALGLAWYLGEESLVQIFESATRVNREKARRPVGMSFVQMGDALEMCAHAVSEKQWAIEYAAEKRSRFKYKYVDAEKSRVKTPTHESLLQMLSAMGLDDPDTLYKRLGASPYAASTGYGTSSMAAPARQPSPRTRFTHPTRPASSATKGLRSAIGSPSSHTVGEPAKEPALSARRNSPRRRWVSSAPINRKPQSGRGTAAALQGADIYASNADLPRRAASASTRFVPQPPPAPQPPLGRQWSFSAGPQNPSRNGSVEPSPRTSPRGRRFTEAALQPSSYSPAPPARPPTVPSNLGGIGLAWDSSSVSGANVASKRLNAASPRRTILGASKLYGGAGGARDGLNAGQSSVSTEQQPGLRANDTGSVMDRDLDARLLREMSTARTNSGEVLSPTKKASLLSDDYYSLGSAGLLDLMSASGFHKAIATAARSHEKQTLSMSSPRQERMRRQQRQLQQVSNS